MPVGSGLCAQFGIAEESTAGTPVTATRFYEVANLKPTHEKITKVTETLRACAKTPRERNRSVVGRGAQLETEFPLASKSLGVWFKHMLGTSAPAATQIGATPLYRQIHLVGDLTGKALTAQGGFPESYSGTVRPYTYNGCKITEWELACSADDVAMAKLKLDAWNWTNATGLAAASYLTGIEEFHFAQLSVKIGGTVSTSAGRTTIAGGAILKGVREVSLKGTNALRTDRRLGSGAGIKSEQIENGFREYTGELDLEFADRTQVADLFDSDASTALEFVWTGLVDVGGGNFPKLSVIYPKVKFDSGFPEVGGPDIVDAKTEFVAYLDDAGTHPVMQIEYDSTDTTV